MIKAFASSVLAVVVTSGSCMHGGSDVPPQQAAAPVAKGPPGSIQVLDLMAPGERRTVSPDWAAIDAQPLGSQGNPVRTLMPQGQQAYLRRLVCPDGSTPWSFRIGNVGAGVYTTIVDAYDVRCGDKAYTIFLDMYHPGFIERRAVPGFSIRPPVGEA